MMKKKGKEQHKAHECSSCDYKSLEDIAMRQVVNQMKIKMEQERLIMAIMPGGRTADSVMADTASRVESLLEYITLGVTTYRMVKKGIDFFKSLKGTSKN